jgi:hypothetical protein
MPDTTRMVRAPRTGRFVNRQCDDQGQLRFRAMKELGKKHDWRPWPGDWRSILTLGSIALLPVASLADARKSLYIVKRPIGTFLQK